MIVLFNGLIFNPIGYAQRLDFSHINFSSADSIASTIPRESIENLPKLVFKLTSDLNTDVEKFRSIFKWISTHIENDFEGYKTTLGKRRKWRNNEERFLKWNGRYRTKVYHKLQKHFKTSCTGYAYLLTQMCALAGLESMIIDGYARTASTINSAELVPNHSWNAVRLNNKWYLCDVTWSAGKIIFEEDIPVFKFSFTEAYFLTSPELFALNHFPIKKEWQLTAEKIMLEDFDQLPLIYKGALENRIIPVAPKRMENTYERSQQINIKLKTPKWFKQPLELLVAQGQYERLLSPEITSQGDETILKFKITSQGIYDVHLVVGGSPICTYVMKIR